MYESVALISPQSTYAVDVLEREFRRRLAGFQVVRSGSRFKLSDGMWELSMTMNGDPAVLEASKEIADRYGEGRPDRDTIASCARRLEIRGGADPQMLHCNDYIVALECLEVFKGIFLFNARGHQWI